MNLRIGAKRFLAPSRLATKVPEQAKAAVWRQRVEMLHVASVYGVAAAIGSGDREQEMAWEVWLAWATRVSQEFNTWESLMGPAPKGLHIGAKVWEAKALVESIDATDDVARRDPFAAAGYDWLELLETLEAACRGVELVGFNPMGEDTLEQPGVDLLGAIEDSLQLLVYGTTADREWCAGSMEIYELLRATRQSRAWRFMDPSPRAALPDVHTDLPARPANLEEALVSFVRSFADLVVSYENLAPDGRELSRPERDSAVRLLRTSALCTRALAGLPPTDELPTHRGKMTLRTLGAIIRRGRRGLVLALSADPERRQLAVSVEELRADATAGT